MVSISLRGHVRADGTLELRIPTKLSDTDVEVMIVLQPVKPEEAESKRAAWPEGYFERTFGSLRDNPITYEPPPDFEARAELS
jgi:hypothetical protein